MQYIVDAYSKMEDGRVSFIRHNQDKLRCDTYKNIKDGNPEQTGGLYSIKIFLFIKCAYLILFYQ